MSVDLHFTPERIRDIRKRLGLSRGQFSRLLDVDERLVLFWEDGERVPDRAKTLQALLDAEQRANGGAK